jgi:hypothetical protein
VLINNKSNKLGRTTHRTIQQGRKSGAWLSVLPSTINGTELSAQEFRDTLSMQYGEAPSNLPLRCDGCDAHFTLQHALGCRTGALVIFCHNEIKDKVVHIAIKAYSPTAVHNKPLIQPCRVAVNKKTLKAGSNNATKTTGTKMMELAKANAGTYLSEVFGPEEPAASLMSASPARMPSLIANELQPKSWKHRKKRRNVSTLGHVSSNNDTSHLLSVPWMAC